MIIFSMIAHIILTPFQNIFGLNLFSEVGSFIPLTTPTYMGFTLLAFVFVLPFLLWKYRKNWKIFLSLISIPLVLTIYMSLAYFAVTKGICAFVFDGKGATNKSACEYKLIQKNGILSDEAVCEQLKNTSRERNDCLMSVAIRVDDVNICKKITDNESVWVDSEQDNCARKVILSRELEPSDNSVCEIIKNVNIKSSCYYDLGIKFNKSEWCARVSDSYYRDSCYSHSAYKLHDESLCENIIDEDSKISCLSSFH